MPLSVTFLDIGQGMAAVIRLPSGRAILWDAGPPFAGSSVVVPYLAHEGVGRLAAVILTHRHTDHVGGMEAVLRRVPADVVLLTGHGWGARTGIPPAAAAVRALLLAGRVPARLAWDGMALAGEPGVTLEFLHPPHGFFRHTSRAQALDENSLALDLTAGVAHALLAGDIKAAGERRLAARVAARPPAALLQLAHHGSDRASSRAFLAAARPLDAVACAGARNRFGFPRPAIVIRVRDRGARLWITGRDGAVRAAWDGGRWALTRFIGQAVVGSPDGGYH